MNSSLDQTSCINCVSCYRQNTPWCKDNCRRCSIAMFSEDTVNIYPTYPAYPNYSPYQNPYPPNYPYGFPAYSPTRKSMGITYYNYPRVTNQYYPSMIPYGNGGYPAVYR